MVGREDIGNAVALNSAMFNGARVIGPAVAGLTIGAFGVSTAFLIDAVCFLAVISPSLAMRESELHTGRRSRGRRPSARSSRTSARASATSAGRRMVLLAILAVGLVSTFGMNFQVVIPPLTGGAPRGATGYGFLMARSASGRWSRPVHRVLGAARLGLIAGGAILLGIASIALGLIEHVLLVARSLMFFAGLGAIAMAATANTTIQLAVPDQLRGRTMSVYTTVFAGSTPIGALLMGWIASQYGVAESIILGGVVCTAIGLTAYAWIRRNRAEEVIAAKFGTRHRRGGRSIAGRRRPVRRAPARSLGPPLVLRAGDAPLGSRARAGR